MGWLSFGQHVSTASFYDSSSKRRSSCLYSLRGSYLTKHSSEKKGAEWSYDLTGGTVGLGKGGELKVVTKIGKRVCLFNESAELMEVWEAAIKKSILADVNDNYILGDDVGEGSFGRVVRARDKVDGAQMAVKIIDKQLADGDSLNRIESEIQILVNLKHENIVQVRDIFDCRETIYIVMDYMNGGNLDQYIADLGSISEWSAAQIISGLLDAISYMHCRGIVHRDIKPENTLFAISPLCVKIVDFGFAKSIRHDLTGTDGGHNVFSTLLGTWNYISPEQVRRQKYGPAVDIWATGITMYEILAGIPPFEAESAVDIMKNIQNEQIEFPHDKWSNISPEAKNLILQLLEKDPAKRPTAIEARAHPWFSKHGHTRNDCSSMNQSGAVHSRGSANVEKTPNAHAFLPCSDTELSTEDFVNKLAISNPLQSNFSEKDTPAWLWSDKEEPPSTGRAKTSMVAFDLSIDSNFEASVDNNTRIEKIPMTPSPANSSKDRSSNPRTSSKIGLGEGSIFKLGKTPPHPRFLSSKSADTKDNKDHADNFTRRASQLGQSLIGMQHRSRTMRSSLKSNLRERSRDHDRIVGSPTHKIIADLGEGLKLPPLHGGSNKKSQKRLDDDMLGRLLQEDSMDIISVCEEACNESFKFLALTSSSDPPSKPDIPQTPSTPKNAKRFLKTVSMRPCDAERYFDDEQKTPKKAIELFSESEDSRRGTNDVTPKREFQRSLSSTFTGTASTLTSPRRSSKKVPTRKSWRGKKSLFSNLTSMLAGSENV